MKAVIFDMDGVLVESAPIWSKAEKEVFTALGVSMRTELRKKTEKMTTSQASRLWFETSPWNYDISWQEAEKMTIERVKFFIRNEECEIPGVARLIMDLKNLDVKIGLATNSPREIIPVVLNKLGVRTCFDAISSLEDVGKRKPDPGVYLYVLKQLQVESKDAIAVEDSSAGVKAAKAAGLKVIGFSNQNRNGLEESVDMLVSDFSDIEYHELFRS